MIRKALIKTNQFFSNFIPDLLMIIVGFIVAWMLAPFDPLGFERFSKNTLIIIFIYSLLLIFLFYLVILIELLLLEFIAKKKLEDLTKLAVIRTEGIELITWRYVATKDGDLGALKERFYDWHKRTLLLFKIIHPVQGEIWGTINYTQIEPTIIDLEDKERDAFLGMFEGKLKVLEEFITDTLSKIE